MAHFAKTVEEICDAHARVLLTKMVTLVENLEKNGTLAAGSLELLAVKGDVQLQVHRAARILMQVPTDYQRQSFPEEVNDFIDDLKENDAE